MLFHWSKQPAYSQAAAQPHLFENCSQVTLNDKDNVRLLKYFEPMVFSSRQIIADIGDVGEAIFYIVEGEAVLIQDNRGVEMEVTRVQRGELMGEMSFFDHIPRQVRIRASKQGANVLRLSRANYERMRKEFPEGATRLLECAIISLDHIFRRAASHIYSLSQYLYGTPYSLDSTFNMGSRGRQ